MQAPLDARSGWRQLKIVCSLLSRWQLGVSKKAAIKQEPIVKN